MIYSGADGSPLLTINGPSNASDFGEDTSDVGDLDGDGLPDVLIGDECGLLVQAHSGFDGSLIHSFTFGNKEGFFGDFLSGAGDIDADGCPDLLIGSVGHKDGSGNDIGKVWVYSGADGSIIRSHKGTPGDEIGWAVGAAGDVNVDGQSDYLATTRKDLFLYSGRDGLTLYEFDSDQPQLEGIGNALDLAGDVDKDGLPDFIAGAPGRDANGNMAGGAYVITGNDFYLYASPRTPTRGDLLSLQSAQETPGQPVVLFLTEVNGSPFVLPIASGALDAAGMFTVQGSVPPGFSGLSFTFQSYVLAADGTVRDSAPELVSFQ